MNSIKKINKAHLCIGCGACKAEFNADIKLYLGVDGKFSVECNNTWTTEDESKLKRICPVLNPGNISNRMWGNTKDVFWGWSNDEKTRYQASSGGVVSQTLKFLLRKKMVDAVLHIEKNTSDPLKNKAVICTSEEDILKGSGSRYAPAVLLDNLHDVLETYSRVAIVGKPCDIRAVKNYVSVNPKYTDRIAYTFSFFCGGMPSEKATIRMIEKLGAKVDEVKELTYRGNGWPGYASIIKNDGSTAQMSYVDSWGKILGRDIHRYCKFCVDGIGEAADFTCGDGWYKTESGYPSHEEHDGRNIILVRTDNGRKLLNEMKNEGEISLENVVDYEPILNYIQPGQLSRRQLLKSRVVPMKLCGQYLPAYPMSCMKKWEQGVDKKYRIKVSLGTIKRLIKGTL